MEKRFKPHAAALVILMKGNSILLLRRAGTGWADGMYTLPSGHIDEGESAAAAAIREAKEEVGVVIDNHDISFASVLHRRNNQNNQVYVDFFFVCTTWSGEPTNKETDKCDEVKWFDVDDLPDNTISYIRNAVANYRHGITFAEDGW
ncbi:NUDIX domain-containing protein [bacterium]|nr:MAG: NUDIX domain-containing protein [bacterium]